MANKYENHVISRSNIRNKDPNNTETPSSASIYTALSDINCQEEANVYSTVENIEMKNNGSLYEVVIPNAEDKKKTKRKCSYRAYVFIIAFNIFLAVCLSILSTFAYNQIHFGGIQESINNNNELPSSDNRTKFNSSVVSNSQEKIITNETLNKLFDHLKINDINILKKIGLYESSPAPSCGLIRFLHPSLLSGYFWVLSGNDSSIQVYCKSFSTAFPMAMRVAKISKTVNGAECFSGLQQSSLNRSSCVIPSDSATCSHTYFSTFNIPYSRVYGIVRAYGIGSPNGFHSSSQNINDNYVDGISFTHGMPTNRHHIYTLAASIGSCYLNRPRFTSYYYICLKTYTTTVSVCSGIDCSNDFYGYPETTTADDIEMRVCRDQSRHHEGIVIEDIELYIQ